MEEYFSEETIRLIICFINSQEIKQNSEHDLPSDPNAPLLQYIEGQGLTPTQRHGSKADPVYTYTYRLFLSGFKKFSLFIIFL